MKRVRVGSVVLARHEADIPTCTMQDEDLARWRVIPAGQKRQGPEEVSADSALGKALLGRAEGERLREPLFGLLYRIMWIGE